MGRRTHGGGGGRTDRCGSRNSYLDDAGMMPSISLKSKSLVHFMTFLQ